MASETQRLLNSHEVPQAVLRRPILFRALTVLRVLVTLREWHVRRTLRRLLRSRSPGGRWLDAGCGAGDLLFSMGPRHEFSQLVGVDPDPANEAAWAAHMGRVIPLTGSIFSFHKTRLESFTDEESFDLATCITALQYCEPGRALEALFAALRPGGTLVLYVPLRPRRCLPRYEETLQRLSRNAHYDSIRHVESMTADRVEAMATGAGFDIRERRFAYGAAGRLYHESLELMQAAASRLPIPLFALVCLVAAPLVYPVLALLMTVDVLTEPSDGNAILLVAQRPGISSE